MNTITMLVNWSFSFIKGASNITSTLNNQVWSGFTILGLVSIGGLLTYLGVAVVKWLIS